MLVVCVLALDLLLEVLLKLMVLLLNVLELLLKLCHFLLLGQKLFCHLGECALLVLLDLLHACIDSILTVVQLLVLALQVDEAASETLNTLAVIFVNVLIVGDNFLQEIRVLAQIAKLALSVFQL